MVEAEVIKQPFTNAQLELLKMFSRQLSETEMVELRKALVQALFKQLTEQVNKVWEEKGWTNDTMDEFLNTKMRRTLCA